MPNQRPSAINGDLSTLPHPQHRNRGAKRAGGKRHLLLAHRLVGRAICAEQGSGEQETAETRAGHAAVLVRWHCLRLRPDILTKPLRLGRNGSSGHPRAGTMKLSIALLAAPALAFAPLAQQARASVKVEARVEKSRHVRSS